MSDGLYAFPEIEFSARAREQLRLTLRPSSIADKKEDKTAQAPLLSMNIVSMLPLGKIVKENLLA